MKIVISDLTRMQKGFCCVAGLEVETGKHIRPVVPGQRLKTALLARHGGPFDIGVITNLGAVTPIPQPPEVEDHAFNPSKAKVVGTQDPKVFWKELEKAAAHRLLDIFGESLIQRGASSCAVDEGKGKASLGCLAPSEAPELYIQERPGKADQVRMRLSDGDFNLDLGVTDIRLYGADHVTADPKIVEQIADQLQKEGSIISVGLTRALASPGYDPVHWLQVNNVHLENSPLWQLG